MKRNWKEKLGKAVDIGIAPTCLAVCFVAAAIGNRHKPRDPGENEFRKMSANTVKTTVYKSAAGYKREIYNFADNTVTVEQQTGAPRQFPVTIMNTKPFSALTDTANLHVARQMQENGANFAKKVNQTNPTGDYRLPKNTFGVAFQ